MNPRFQETKYGFDWGAASITRTASVPDGSVIVSIETDKELVHIRITKTGFIRIIRHPKRKHETQKIPLDVEKE